MQHIDEPDVIDVDLFDSDYIFTHREHLDKFYFVFKRTAKLNSVYTANISDSIFTYITKVTAYPVVLGHITLADWMQALL
jgi:hypothetical protein